MRYTDTDPGTGIRTYRLSALNAKGKVQSVLTSNSVDPKKAAPLPDPPAMLAAEPSEAGVDFSWENPPQNIVVPVLGFVLEREDAKAIAFC